MSYVNRGKGNSIRVDYIVSCYMLDATGKYEFTPKQIMATMDDTHNSYVQNMESCGVIEKVRYGFYRITEKAYREMTRMEKVIEKHA